MPTIEQKLRSIEAGLVAVEQEKHVLLAKRQELLAAQQTSKEPTTSAVKSLTTQEKVDLFARLFRGRDDIYALRWENRAGRSGYSVACSNEWQHGLCDKSKTKCGECRNRAFRSLDKTVIFDHLSGKCTVGLYPLLIDDHCWLLAVDFDRSDWQLAVAAFRKACTSLEIPCAVERSRSGAGAHVWMFFDNSIPALDARRFGFALLDRAMEYHAELSFDSYDRLFPNQDIMPDGGFGNLIALPLQHGPRQSSNSEFVDEHLVAYEDQWAFLNSLIRVSVKQIYDYLEREDKTTDSGEAEIQPWQRSLPVERANVSISSCPESITVVLANRIYLSVDRLPSILLARLKRIASFSNPEFFKTQALRFSTNGIPRFICLAYIDQGYLSLPRGCFDDMAALLAQQSIAIDVDDKRKRGLRLKGLRFKGELRKDQKKAVADLAKHDVGVLHAPTAFGKTVTAIGLIHKRKVNTLILVHNRQLLDQWRERLAVFLEGATIGVIGAGKRNPTGEIDVATYQSMIIGKEDSVDPHLFDYGQVIIDECHHISAPKYETLLSEVHAKYVLGITATPQRRDGHHPIVFMQAGPIRHTVKLDNEHRFEQHVIVRRVNNPPPLELTGSDARPHIAHIYRWLMNDATRNRHIINDVLLEVAQGRNPIMLTERREHAVILGALLEEHGVSYLVLRGAMKTAERKAALDALGDIQVLIATGKYVGEGFDLPKLDTLFLALPISWKGLLVQYAGRIHRQIEGKVRVKIYDYVDVSLPTLLKMYQRRSKGYAAMGYTIAEGNDGRLIQADFAFPEANQ